MSRSRNGTGGGSGRGFGLAAIILGLALSPVSVMAEGQGIAAGHGLGKGGRDHATAHIASDNGSRRADNAVKNGAVKNGAAKNGAKNAKNAAKPCPPGLAKRDPACVPPGQARKGASGPVVGAIIDLGSVHLVTRPGLYGLGTVPQGSRYAIIDNRLVRVDSKTGKILSIIRMVDAILD